MFDQGKTTAWDSYDSCDDSELVYCSNLHENMTFLGNADMTVHFVCISFPILEDEIVSSSSGNVSFAVQTTSVILLLYLTKIKKCRIIVQLR